MSAKPSQDFSKTAAAPTSAPVATFVPQVVESTGRGERGMDVISRLAMSRIIAIDTQIDESTAAVVTKLLLFLNKENPDEPIHMYINSPGGSITAGMAIINVMNNISAPVHTYGLGMCASMGSFILSAGKPGERYVMPDTKVMIHQPAWGSRGQQTEMDVAAKSIAETRREMESYYADFMGVDYDAFKKLIAATTERDNYLNATLAVKMGLVDKIIDPSLSAKPEDQAWKKQRFERALWNHAKDIENLKRLSDEEADHGFTLAHRKAILEIIDRREATKVPANSNKPGISPM